LQSKKQKLTESLPNEVIYKPQDDDGDIYIFSPSFKIEFEQDAAIMGRYLQLQSDRNLPRTFLLKELFLLMTRPKGTKTICCS